MSRFCKKCAAKTARTPSGVCKPCGARRSAKYRNSNRKQYRATSTAWYKVNREKVLSRTAAWHAANQDKCKTARATYRNRIKAAVFAYYGPFCTCCGEPEPLFLSIDHINNDGGAVRKSQGMGGSFYQWIIKHNFPSDLQVLCMNCNHAKMRNHGICPHQLIDAVRRRI